MFTLSCVVRPVLAPFAPLFSKRVFHHAVLLVTGTLLAPARRTVTAALRMLGLEDSPRFQNFHRVLSRARWCARRAAQILLRSLVAAFAPDGPLVFAIDETLERRWGRKIKARGIYRDPVRSSRGHFVKASGLRWMSLMLLAPVSWAGRIWALPFFSVLCPSERYAQQKGKRHKTLLDWARQMILQLARSLPERSLIVVCDSSFAALEWLDAVRPHATVITQLRLDAALYEPAPARPPGTIGRPRVKGKRKDKLSKVLEDEQTLWQRIRVSHGYGKKAQELEIATATAVWYHAGLPVVPLRWVLVRDPTGKLEPKAYLCTDLNLTAVEILGYFLRRWQVEVTFAEVRRHLGVESQRQWSDRAIARTTPCLLGLFSVVALAADRLHGQENSIRARPPGTTKRSRPSVMPSPRCVTICGASRLFSCRPRKPRCSISPDRRGNGLPTPLPMPRDGQSQAERYRSAPPTEPRGRTEFRPKLGYRAEAAGSAGTKPRSGSPGLEPLILDHSGPSYDPAQR